MGRKRTKDNHLPQRMYLRSGTYYLSDYVTGKWHNLGKIYSKAMAEYGQLTDPDKPCRTVADLLERYLKEISPTKAESTYLGNIKESKFLRAALGHILITQLTPIIIYQYMDARGKKTQVRANRELALLSIAFTYAIRWGYADRNPCKGIMRFKEKPRERYIEDWEYLAFREFAGPFIGAYMDFKYVTGLRKGDILKIKLNQLKDDGIHVFIHKTKKSIVVEWTDLLKETVDNIRKVKRPITGLYLIATKKGQPYSDSGFSSIWQRKMKKAFDTGVIKERFTDHDLRGKTGSDTDLQHAVELLGHADKRITERHYRRKDKKVSPLR